MTQFRTVFFSVALGGILLTGCQQSSEQPAATAPAPATQTAPAVTASETAPADGAAAETPATGEQEKPADAPAATAPAAQ